jgi:glycerol-3-phosphate acyltransferase PlsY
LDILKVFLPTLAIKLLFPGEVYFLAAGLAGMAGHIWPIYHRFHGGAGYSAAVGILLAVDWPAIFVTIVVGLILGLVILRNLDVAILSWMWLLIPWFWIRTQDVWFILFSVGINILFMLAMIPEIQKMMEYKKKGKLTEYGVGYLKSNPMGRGYLKMAKFFNIEIR